MKRNQPTSNAQLEKALLAKLTPMLIDNIRATVHLVLADAPAKAAPEGTRLVRNGVTQPPAGGKCRAIWDELDKLVVANKGQVPKVTEIMAAAREADMNENNARCEYYYWRRFNGYGKKPAAKAAKSKPKGSTKSA